ncbi:hypothetical protein RESH_02887 [Rhodopirellula europaea SH398]|uniref:Uncharacterized protein n=1 Tax=Rhodopirellula europaea SH398 TaxID=1263868 RepID=M5S503_9BACT|nr:hypothetical protein RESH_02887 [Rhodopirellula europaea SH398]
MPRACVLHRWPSTMARTEGVAPVSPVTECTQGDSNRFGVRDGQ